MQSSPAVINGWDDSSKSVCVRVVGDDEICTDIVRHLDRHVEGPGFFRIGEAHRRESAIRFCLERHRSQIRIAATLEEIFNDLATDTVHRCVDDLQVGAGRVRPNGPHLGPIGLYDILSKGSYQR